MRSRDGAAVQLLEGGSGDDGELLFAATSGMLRDQLGNLGTQPGQLVGAARRPGIGAYRSGDQRGHLPQLVPLVALVESNG